MTASSNLGSAASRPLPPAAPIRVGVIGATGYVGGELIRLLSAHPSVRLVGLTGRERRGDAVGTVHPHLSTTDHVLDSELVGEVDAVFLALPHGAAAARVPELLERGITVIDQGPDFRLRDAAGYPRWYGFEHPHPELLGRAVYGLPELHRAELVAAAVSFDAEGSVVAAETIASRVRRADSSRTREWYGRGLDSLSMSAYYPHIHNTVMMVNSGGAV